MSAKIITFERLSRRIRSKTWPYIWLLFRLQSSFFAVEVSKKWYIGSFQRLAVVVLKSLRAIYEYVSHRFHQGPANLFNQGNQRRASTRSPFIDCSSSCVGYNHCVCWASRRLHALKPLANGLYHVEANGFIQIINCSWHITDSIFITNKNVVFLEPVWPFWINVV